MTTKCMACSGEFEAEVVEPPWGGRGTVCCCVFCGSGEVYPA